MKKLFFLIALHFCFFEPLLHAQEATTQKFDIGLDIQAFIVSLTFTIADSPEIDLIYRHKLKDSHNRLRVKVGYENFGFFDYKSISRYLLETGTGTIQKEARTVFQNAQRFRINLGYQKSIKTKNRNLYFGADILYWLTKGQTEGSIKEVRDLTSSCFCSAVFSSQTWDASVHALGLQPFFGLEARFNKSWYLTLELGFPIYTSFGKGFFHLNENGEVDQIPVSAVFKRIKIGRLELADIAINYRF